MTQSQLSSKFKMRAMKYSAAHSVTVNVEKCFGIGPKLYLATRIAGALLTLLVVAVATIRLNEFKIREHQLTLSTVFSFHLKRPNLKPFFDPIKCHSSHINLSTSTSILKKSAPLDQIGHELEELSFGGKYTPTDCQPEYHVALIIPYRNRPANLKMLLRNIHPLLVKQRASYGIYLIEPLPYLTFNRGLLMNAGFIEALKDDGNWNCFIFHDVDMVPEVDANVYKCDENYPVHYAVSLSSLNYKNRSFYEDYFGGINAFTRSQFLRMNGFSNSYFGWGGEALLKDDDAFMRAKFKFGRVVRPDPDIARYTVNTHPKETPNPDRIFNESISEMIEHGGDIRDGLKSLRYRVVARKTEKLFTRYHVTYEKPGLAFSTVATVGAVCLFLFSLLLLSNELISYFHLKSDSSSLREKLVISAYFFVVLVSVTVLYY